MPELPDITIYLRALEPREVGEPIERARAMSPFLLRTWDPPLDAIEGKTVRGLRRLGKRIVLCLDDDLFLVLHLMIAGRLHWKPRGARPARGALAVLEFAGGTLVLTEAGSKRRASLHLVRGEGALLALDPGGLEVLDSSLEAFDAALRRENRTLKRAFTDPRLFSGIGNAYSDELLWRARLSPLQRTANLGADEVARLHAAAQSTLREWIDRLAAEAGSEFPEKVTAFRPGMAVHGRFRQPCTACGSPVQRIRYAENECNYCPGCQTGGVLLADRALSRLLKGDWPRTLEELEALRRPGP